MNQTAEINENMKKLAQWMTIGMRIAADPSLVEKLSGNDWDALMALQSKTQSEKNGSRKRKRRKNGYAVQDEELLYKLSDAGLLCKLHGVNSKTEPRTYYFDEDFDVKGIVEEHNRSVCKVEVDGDGNVVFGNTTIDQGDCRTDTIAFKVDDRGAVIS